MSNWDESDQQLPSDDLAIAGTAANELLILLFREPSLWSGVRLTAADMPTLDSERIFTVLQRLHREGVTPTKSIVADELKKLDPSVQGPGDWRIQRLAHGTAARENLDSYQRIIRRAAELQRLRALRSELDELIGRGDTSAAYAALHRSLAEVPDQGKRRSMREVLARVMEEIDQPTPPVPFGLGPLDGLLAGGIRPGEVFVLAARPSVGKSAFAGQVILHVAQEVGPVALWTLEMSPEQWVRRALSQRAHIGSKRIRTGRLLEDDFPRLAHAAAFLNNLPVKFADTSDTTPEAWALEASRLVREEGVKLLVVDYLGLLDPPRGAWSRENEVARHSRMIKKTALQLGVPALVLHQLNRDADDRPPTMRHLRESGAIEQDADQIGFIHRDRNQETTLLEEDGLLILAKQRDGETGVIPISFDAAHYRFYPRVEEPKERPSSRFPRRLAAHTA